ncbi:hypothetical protein H4R18_005326 [Coemansia javaensis]|uniref:Peptidase S1 domain-containing protein n=1 Tax=Coemansia javaensis TaxID=2761396 RepID=A0A9W8H6B6_9FUNG|nr:hypothetical protein H4R18_005326 [Coemansia javaensis]
MSLGQARPIVGGSPAAAHAFPFAVYLSIETQPRWHAVCGGTLISQRHVVTAAHCVHGVADRARAVRVGVGDAQVRRQARVRARAVHVHPRFDARTLANDIAVVELERDVAPDGGGRARRVPLYFGPVDAGTVVTAMGWGVTTNAAGARTVAAMNRVDLVVADPAECRAVDAAFATSNGPFLCTATHPGARDQCSGDSGAPVVMAVGRRHGRYHRRPAPDLRLVALTSYGDNAAHDARPPCADPRGFGFSTHVAYYQAFLTNATGLSRAQLEAPVRADRLQLVSAAAPPPAAAAAWLHMLALLLACVLVTVRRH